MSDLQQCPCCGQPWREKVAPVQGYAPGIPWSIHLEAYAAYCKRWGPQPALIDLEGRHCRGGFGTEELDGFVPGWRERVSEIHHLRARLAELEAAAAVVPETVPEQWRPMDAAPTDGTIVRLLVDYSADDACHPLEDTQVAQTIGGNTDGHTGLEEGWKFAGWSWEQDCFTEGRGKPLGWLPMGSSVPDGVRQPCAAHRELFGYLETCHYCVSGEPTPGPASSTVPDGVVLSGQEPK